MIYARKNSENEDFVIFDPKMRQIRHFCRKFFQNFYKWIKNLTTLGSVKVKLKKSTDLLYPEPLTVTQIPLEFPRVFRVTGVHNSPSPSTLKAPPLPLPPSARDLLGLFFVLRNFLVLKSLRSTLESPSTAFYNVSVPQKKNHFVFNSCYFLINIVKTERNNVIRSATLYHNSQP